MTKANEFSLENYRENVIPLTHPFVFRSVRTSIFHVFRGHGKGRGYSKYYGILPVIFDRTTAVHLDASPFCVTDSKQNLYAIVFHIFDRLAEQFPAVG